MAKVMPTASASMLVATAIRNIVFDVEPGAPLIPPSSRRGLPQHVAADEGQQHKRDPRRDGVDVFFKARAEQVADHRHQRLKSAEPHAADGAAFEIGFSAWPAPCIPTRRRRPWKDPTARSSNSQFPFFHPSLCKNSRYIAVPADFRIKTHIQLKCRYVSLIN
jgi:hypothetical protein